MTELLAPETELTPRRARLRNYVMCRPEHFEVTYSINPWMNPEKPTDKALAIAQWENLRTVFAELGHYVQTITPAPGLPDMVFAANGALVVDDKVLISRFRHPERQAEADLWADWFRDHGYREVVQAAFTSEGEGDYVTTGRAILAGNGFRSDPRSQAEAEALFGRPVVSLKLIDPRFYHLDTALAALDDDEIVYYPGAFDTESLRVLETLFPNAVLADEEDALLFGLNLVSDGCNVILPEPATALAAKLRARGFHTQHVDLSELLKAGGSVKCCTLEIRH
ncbi:amidinotransferase [Streptomyces ipomoeae]|jgi:N-dimethylarginine dimethylaminohydrolase|uniref:Amidinotransferase n=2 Tax=Streptomyces ipomoeae TaxID=103232 RepID=L1KV81_9ACTN|nr:dimethylargininase [Streptomyces ipomoeae]EKX64365.1 amidinotransferase [Streptomyces ipomoeae 91-03]MDX2693024.1 amidinotransferase [Streptomyces ipomoeae]MDX2820808.1 amidinotransferase [Streptomyces ipomoeae]MDX2838530.1 amidinotransferase [Streptomyces ipomoeae]MDX2872586.1 amidinotransferase [Streptomyces ipomoeae]